MEFSEKDIKAVARFRFWEKRQWIALIVLLACVAIASACSLLLESWVGYIPMAVLVGGFIWLYKAQSKWEKKFLEEWETEKTE